ncbi:MAG: VOC family protein [Thermodesulfobacteriota bacterium]
MAKVIGIGGIFFKSNDPEKLAEWYKKCLGFVLESEKVSTFKPENMPDGAFAVWSPFDLTTEYFEPSKKEYMINLIVDDLVQALFQVKQGGGEIIDDVQKYEYGLFGWFIDPDGNKIELWQPK